MLVYSHYACNETATTEIYTLSLHDALPISRVAVVRHGRSRDAALGHRHVQLEAGVSAVEDRKSTRLNSSHLGISYAVFCLKKKNLKYDLGKHWGRQQVKWHRSRQHAIIQWL